MRKVVKLALVAGAAGAAAGGVQAFRQDEPSEVIAQKALKGAGEAAAVGAVIGFVLDRRARRKLAKAKARAGFGAALTTGGLVEVARAALPALEHARGVVSHVASQAADSARPRVEHAVEVARPKVEHAARVARDRALEAAEAARPLVTRDRGLDGLGGPRPILVRVA